MKNTSQKLALEAIKSVPWVYLHEEIVHGSKIDLSRLTDLKEAYDEAVEKANEEIALRKKLIALFQAAPEYSKNPERDKQMTDQAELDIRVLAGALEAYERTHVEIIGQLLAIESAAGLYNVLIHEPYFVEYTKQTIEESHGMPAGLPVNDWPYRYLKFDFEAAAEDLSHEWALLELDGRWYFIQ